MNWTDERVELLRKLWAEGFSASQIATQLGGITRNAVIGKAHRLKLAGRTKAQPRMRKPQAAGALPAAPAADQTAGMPLQGGGLDSAGMSAAAGGGNGGGRMRRRAGGMAHMVGAAALKMDFMEDIAAEPALRHNPQENVVVSMARRLSLMQLTEYTCKWPVGDPLSKDFYFCGADSEESGSYCRCHAKLAFNSGDKRKN